MSVLTEEQKANLADGWFAQLNTVQDMVRKRRTEHARPIRIALISFYGVDLMHTDFQDHAASIRANCTHFSGFFGDRDGYGSYRANVVLKTAPDVSLYVAQTAGLLGSRELQRQPERTTEALYWAIENRVDIIVLFNLFSEDHLDIKTALTVAKGHGIMTLSHAGSQARLWFPANQGDLVCCIGTADSLGEGFAKNPPANGIEMYSALGDCVLGSWVKAPDLFGQHDTTIRKSGSGTAVAVAAGIAALLLDYTRAFMDVSDGYTGMRKLFGLISKPSGIPSYRYLDIIAFFSQGSHCEELIKAALTENAPQEDYNWTTGNDHNLIHLCIIDKGGFGEVHKVTPQGEELTEQVYKRSNDKTFARKVIYRRPGRASELEILNEARAIEKLCKDSGNKHIVTVFDHGWLTTANYYFFDMELGDFTLENYVLGGKIEAPFEVLRNFGPDVYSTYNLSETSKIMEQLTSAIAFIHGKGEIHRDLKPRNVLFSWKATAWKITDFGLTAEGGSKKANTTVYARGSSGYRAPELIEDEHRTFTNKVDIWALGCILFEIFSGKKAFANDFMIFDYRQRGKKLQFDRADQHSTDNSRDSLNEILDNMLEIEPSARKTAEDFHTEFLSLLLRSQRL